VGRTTHVADERDLGGLGLAELRARRSQALAEEADLSYLRRLLQGRIDILRAELARREGREDRGAAASAVERLPEILAEIPSQVRRSARHMRLAPPRSRYARALADELMGEVGLADLSARADGELAAACERLTAKEREVSGRRRELQAVADACSAEITRRYRAGEARIDDLLEF
jgi:hypothetical protein